VQPGGSQHVESGTGRKLTLSDLLSKILEKRCRVLDIMEGEDTSKELWK
jgi:hypothetical protein